MSKTLTVPVTTGTAGTVSLLTTEPPADSTNLKTTCSDFTTAIYSNVIQVPNVGTSGNLTSGLQYYINLLITFKTDIEAVSNINLNGTINFGTSGTGATADHQAINTFLKKLEESKKTLYTFAATCRAESKEVNLSEFDAQKQTTEESKLRLDGIRNSETQVSYYEGWFPLFRPMSETSLFTLFAISIALLLVSIVAFLRMQGLEIQILTPFTGVDTMAMLRGYSTYIGIAMAAGIGVAFAAVKMNWV